jgi:hypothetical protein
VGTCYARKARFVHGQTQMERIFHGFMESGDLHHCFPFEEERMKILGVADVLYSGPKLAL